MTEPDPIAELAAQLTELRGQWARSQGEIGVIRAKLEENAGLESTLRLEIKKLRRRLDDADKRRAAEPKAPQWQGLDLAGFNEQIRELHSWVESFLRPQYSGYLVTLRPCWPNHPEARQELATLKAEHERIFAKAEDEEEGGELKGLLAFHDRWLPGVLTRVTGAIKCDETGCRNVRRD